MPHRITLLPGDGVGPEITEATRKVLAALDLEFEWEVGIVGELALQQFGTPLPEKVLESIRKNKVALKGPVTTPIGTGFRSINVALRQNLDLYACLRPCKTYTGIRTPFPNVDIVIVRENKEDLYSGIEFARGSLESEELRELIVKANYKPVTDDTGFSIKVISETNSRRIVKFAFEYARAYNRRKVTAVHKANILKFSDGLFLNVARDIATQYTDIEFDDVLVDAACMRLVKNPQAFDVMVLPNLYGDIVSDLCAGLVGGLGVAPGANMGDNMAIFEPTHGSAPKYRGQNKVNPMAMILSAKLMLDYIGEKQAAVRLEKAIASVIAEGKKLTYDLKANSSESAATTSEVADAVIEKLNIKGGHNA